MVNKEQRGNREKRKPRKEKPKTGPHISSYAGGEPALGKKPNG
jgi:hypothetical protein